MPGRIVSADIAADWNHHEGDLTEGDLAHTVVVQAEQISAVLALHYMAELSTGERVCPLCSSTYTDAVWPCPTARALGVTA